MEARTVGINHFITDFGAQQLSSTLKMRAQPFSGWIGERENNGNMSVSTYVALKIDPKIFRGVVAKLFTIEFYANGINGEDLTVTICDRDYLEYGEGWSEEHTAEVTNGRAVIAITDEILEEFNFQSEQNQCRELYLVVNTSDYPGIQIRNNKIKCCGKKFKWMPYVAPSGVTATTLAGLVDAAEAQYSYGFRVNMSITCGNTWLCQDFDFINDPWARVMAECIGLYAVKKLAGIILTNPYPEKYTMISREEISGHLQRVNTLLSERMPWLVQNMPATATDCFICNDRIRVGEILV